MTVEPCFITSQNEYGKKSYIVIDLKARCNFPHSCTATDWYNKIEIEYRSNIELDLCQSKSDPNVLCPVMGKCRTVTRTTVLPLTVLTRENNDLILHCLTACIGLHSQTDALFDLVFITDSSVDNENTKRGKLN